MLQKSRSTKTAQLKYLVLIPLILGMLTYVSCSEEKEGKPVQNQEVPPTPPTPPDAPMKHQEGETNKVPFMAVEEVPVYPGCEALEGNEARKECMSAKIMDFVNTNFDTNKTKPYAQEGVNRIYVKFVISATGEVTDVQARASSPELQEEAVRVVESLPKMTAGKENKEPVQVIYSLPIVFQVNE